jgi:hypothetical protein
MTDGVGSEGTAAVRILATHAGDRLCLQYVETGYRSGDFVGAWNKGMGLKP